MSFGKKKSLSVSFSQVPTATASNLMICPSRILLLRRDVVAASNVKNIVEGTVALNPEAIQTIALGLRGADTGWVRSSAGRRVWIFRSGEGDGNKRSDDIELHFGY
jgi:hypothetical protein